MNPWDRDPSEFDLYQKFLERGWKSERPRPKYDGPLNEDMKKTEVMELVNQANVEALELKKQFYSKNGIVQIEHLKKNRNQNG